MRRLPGDHTCLKQERHRGIGDNCLLTPATIDMFRQPLFIGELVASQKARALLNLRRSLPEGTRVGAKCARFDKSPILCRTGSEHIACRRSDCFPGRRMLQQVHYFATPHFLLKIFSRERIEHTTALATLIFRQGTCCCHSHFFEKRVLLFNFSLRETNTLTFCDCFFEQVDSCCTRSVNSNRLASLVNFGHSRSEYSVALVSFRRYVLRLVPLIRQTISPPFLRLGSEHAAAPARAISRRDPHAASVICRRGFLHTIFSQKRSKNTADIETANCRGDQCSSQLQVSGNKYDRVIVMFDQNTCCSHCHISMNNLLYILSSKPERENTLVWRFIFREAMPVPLSTFYFPKQLAWK